MIEALVEMGVQHQTAVEVTQGLDLTHDGFVGYTEFVAPAPPPPCRVPLKAGERCVCQA